MEIFDLNPYMSLSEQGLMLTLATMNGSSTEKYLTKLSSDTPEETRAWIIQLESISYVSIYHENGQNVVVLEKELQ